MARSVFVVISDDPNVVQKARSWGYENNVSVQAFSPGQWDQGLENGAFRQQLRTDGVSLAGGQYAVGGNARSNVVPFPSKSVSDSGKVATMNEIEAQAIENAIMEYRGNLTEAAKALGIGRATLYRKVKQYNIDPSVARNKAAKAA